MTKDNACSEDEAVTIQNIVLSFLNVIGPFKTRTDLLACALTVVQIVASKMITTEYFTGLICCSVSYKVFVVMNYSVICVIVNTL